MTNSNCWSLGSSSKLRQTPWCGVTSSTYRTEASVWFGYSENAGSCHPGAVPWFLSPNVRHSLPIPVLCHLVLNTVFLLPTVNRCSAQKWWGCWDSIVLVLIRALYAPLVGSSHDGMNSESEGRLFPRMELGLGDAFPFPLISTNWCLVFPAFPCLDRLPNCCPAMCPVYNSWRCTGKRLAEPKPPGPVFSKTLLFKLDLYSCALKQTNKNCASISIFGIYRLMCMCICIYTHYFLHFF